MGDIGGVMMLSAAIFVVPTLISRFVIGGEWRQVGTAYAIWFGLLFLTLVVPGSGKLTEKFGWMLIMSMFLSIVAVPVLTLIQRIGSWALFKLS